jgi:hypothetical protein
MFYRLSWTLSRMSEPANHSSKGQRFLDESLRWLGFLSRSAKYRIARGETAIAMQAKCFPNEGCQKGAQGRHPSSGNAFLELLAKELGRRKPRLPRAGIQTLLRSRNQKTVSDAEPTRALRHRLVGSDLRADRSSKAAHRKTRSPRRCHPACRARLLGPAANQRRDDCLNGQLFDPSDFVVANS